MRETVPSMCLRDEGTQCLTSQLSTLSYTPIISTLTRTTWTNLDRFVWALLIITCDRLAVIESEEDDILKLKFVLGAYTQAARRQAS